MMLSHGDSFSLHTRYKGWFGAKTKHEDIFRAYHESIKLHKEIRIVVNLSRKTTTEQAERSVPSGQSPGLLPTTSGISQGCPRFRILVIGKTGVGKSSLIGSAFRVGKEIVAHNKPGDANIDDEVISSQNDRFVLHNSKGFEPGDQDNLKIVRDFVGPDLAARATGRSKGDGFVGGVVK
ncbi:uncharacterized protein F5891DRAFT_32353 [Suillus fuscotomentosus]|uniref:G domain-containing protein n=1 Tax=Suillus fuscotomentosus TaxID=1912939 RepID=A0AAD4EMG9_9AGAM|nr:uncharacterized protein F5891DRAFT_32353 [Suillus fuscotomentosus]KAG1908902.1 hypothetical protein F5891DRAFT_32353 [Suillus fuscotomentosus]